MTPAEWLAAIILGKLVLDIIWEVAEPNSKKVKYNSNMRLVTEFAASVVVLVLVLVVLF